MRKTAERRKVVGERHHRAKFSDHEVYLMRELRDEGMKLSEIAEKFETAKSTVSDICSGRRRSQYA